MLDPLNADALRAKVLITEATFLDDSTSIEHARQHGHAHISELIENAQWIRNKAVLLTHFSSRYNIEVLL
ncbi:mitochondrial 3'-tRNA processing endonuclease Trz2 [Trifolium repens]|nr:mitochondrial 3'-tRNA processing endonuclease Trz2 [Trifolium repens]